MKAKHLIVMIIMIECICSKVCEMFGITEFPAVVILHQRGKLVLFVVSIQFKYNTFFMDIDLKFS